MTEFWSLGQRANNIQRLLFYLLILFIPTQFGQHFWPEFAFVRGARIDYLSPTLYATDIIIILIFVFSVAKFQISNLKSQINSKFLKSKFPIIILTFLLVIGILFSKSPQTGIFGLIKLFEFGLLGFYVAFNIRKLKLENILLMFSIGIIFESFLSIAQYFNHGSINGIFYFFGERFFNPQTLGIANASLNGELILRPYGTFSHPNVLAGYLIIAMAMIILNIKNQISKIRKAFYLFTTSIGTVALFLTLSRIAIILWVLILGFFLIRKLIINHSSLIILALVGLLLLGLVTPLGSRFTDIKLTDESIVQRESLIQSSITMIKDNPLFGVGLNNFLVNLPTNKIIQPVHNIFFLIAAETGIVGLGFLVWFLVKTYRRSFSFIIYPLSLILILGLFDHYFLTLQQGQLLFTFILGLCWAKGFHNSLPQFYPKRFLYKIIKTRTFPEI